ncbi:hypothetical protein LZ198_33170 [Myxococcus sp. K15C18031901]|uniref:hypothetical protein n=1 Tax=Myxococcus dinghuensis TaxID=2906761 RepID=UPI0020A7D1A5|nr:hypothetical protein [Myxococcus dinghuensis]MCP3103746.1 hypothetical protein [Myxococcus dinghuensis]
MTSEQYPLGVGEAGKLKLRATALLAEGGEARVFEGLALLHDAARAEARALQVLEHPSAEVRLASAVEQCACFVEGRAPTLAARAWGQVLDTARALPENAVGPMLARLEPRYLRLVADFVGALRKAPRLARTSASVEFLQGRELRRYLRELETLRSRFPGTPGLWWSTCRLEQAQGRPRAAWAAIQRAVRLDPDNVHYAAVRLLLMPRALPTKQVEALLVETYAGIQRAPPEVCLVFALHEMARARRGTPATRATRLERALEAVIQGRSRQGTPPEVSQSLHAAQLLVTEQRKGHEATLDLLYRAGLGEAVVSSPAGKRVDAFRFLSQHVTQALTRHAA